MDLEVCRMCLSVDARMHVIVDTPLQEVYEKLTGKLLQNTDGKPIKACYVCHHMLKKSRTFIEKSLRADELLHQMLDSGIELTLTSIGAVDSAHLRRALKTSSVECMSVGFPEPEQENIQDAYIEVKIERETDANETGETQDLTDDVELHEESPSAPETDSDAPLMTCPRAGGSGMSDAGHNKEVCEEDQGTKPAESQELVGLPTAYQLDLDSEDEKGVFMQNYKEQRHSRRNMKFRILRKDAKKSEAAGVKQKSSNKTKRIDKLNKNSVNRINKVNRNSKRIAMIVKNSLKRIDNLDTSPVKINNKNIPNKTDKSNKAVKDTTKNENSIKNTDENGIKVTNKDENDVYNCKLCGAILKSEQLLDDHIKYLHLKARVHPNCLITVTGSKDKPFRCNQCDKAFRKKHHLLGHFRVHTGEKPYVCDRCDKAFSEASALRYHLKLHTGAKHYHCGQCEKSFTLKSHLDGHIRMHKGEKLYPCSLCDKAFNQKGHLERHTKLHTGEKPYPCRRCGKAFSRKEKLKEHVRIHTGERPYGCDQCGKTFTLKGNLNKHLRVHAGEKPYGCIQCDKAFLLKSDLERHIRMHTGAKPYLCDGCDKAFRVKCSLKKHKSLNRCSS